MITLWVIIIISLTPAPDNKIVVMSLGAYKSEKVCTATLDRIEETSKATLKFARACVPVALNSSGGSPA